LISDRLSVDPRHLDGWHESRATAPENATDRIPESVHGPLLTWAVRFVDDWAEDVLAADRLWRVLRDPTRYYGAGRNSGAGDDIHRVFGEYLTHQRPLPGYRGQINVNFLAGLAGVSRKAIRLHRGEIAKVATVVGIDAETYFPITITGQLDERPWLEGITNDHRPNHGLHTLARMLMASRICPDRVPIRRAPRSSTFVAVASASSEIPRANPIAGKSPAWPSGENDPNGVEATWTVGAPAARAIILQRLQPPETDLLFACLARSPGHKPTVAATNAALTTKATNIQLAKLIEWINDYCTVHSRADRIPLVNNRPWRPSTRQFRRTLAWFIARRPGGAIAGAICYRHQAVQMFGPTAVCVGGFCVSPLRIVRVVGGRVRFG
jgi:hypothetical protein